MGNVDIEALAASNGHTVECLDLAAESLEGAGFPDMQEAIRRAPEALAEGDCTCHCEPHI